MRVAAIDVGTNSTRLLVAEDLADGFRSIDRRMIITRLGQGVDRNRALDPEAVERTLRVVADYAATCGELGVEKVRVTGTSAVRDARNKDEFINGVRALTGQAPEVLTGDQEAAATFLGVLTDLPPQGPVLVVDIGGGSTELIYGEEEPTAMVSLDIGCVRMFEKYLHSDPPNAEELEALRDDVGSAFASVKDDLAVPAGARMIGVAGTLSQLARLKTGSIVYDPDVTHHSVLSHGDVRRLARRLESLPYEKRARVQGLEKGRVDVIVAGAEILQIVMETFDAAEVLVSEKDILDGLVLQLLEDSPATD
jgi:exopolyphosphatase / guanosine-5'-triphosphate,3'-diphosphate pyrophosphatase